MRDYQQQKSKFCNSKTALEELNKIALKGKFKYLVLSYNSEGIMKEKDIFSVLQKYGKVELVEFDYLRFKSNNKGESKHKKIYQRTTLYFGKMNNLWILTEERPKKQVLAVILQKFTQDYKLSGFIDSIRILPILQGGKFAFTYEVTGFRCNKVNKVYIKTVSGNSSFTDFLIFFQKRNLNKKIYRFMQ